MGSLPPYAVYVCVCTDLSVYIHLHLHAHMKTRDRTPSAAQFFFTQNYYTTNFLQENNLNKKTTFQYMNIS